MSNLLYILRQQETYSTDDYLRNQAMTMIYKRIEQSLLSNARMGVKKTSFDDSLFVDIEHRDDWQETMAQRLVNEGLGAAIGCNKLFVDWS